MKGFRFRNGLSIAALALAIAMLAACGSLSGKYEAPQGVLSVEFKGSKAYIATTLTTVQADYEVNGDKIILKMPSGTLVLVRNRDGSLDSPFGKLTRSRS